MLAKHLYEKHKKAIAMVEHGEILLRNYDLSYKDNIVKIKQGDKRDVINKASSMVKNSVINFSILENEDDYEAYFSAAKVGVSAIGAHTIPSSKRDTCVNIEDTLIDLYSSYKCEEFEKNVIPNLKLVSFLNNISAIFITDFNSDLMGMVCIKEYLLLDKEKVNKALEVFIGDNGVKIDEKQVFKYISQEYAMKLENELRNSLTVKENNMTNASKIEIGNNIATKYNGRVVKGVITSISGENLQILLKNNGFKVIERHKSKVLTSFLDNQHYLSFLLK